MCNIDVKVDHGLASEWRHNTQKKKQSMQTTVERQQSKIQIECPHVVWTSWWVRHVQSGQVKCGCLFTGWKTRAVGGWRSVRLLCAPVAMRHTVSSLDPIAPPSRAFLWMKSTFSSLPLGSTASSGCLIGLGWRIVFHTGFLFNCGEHLSASCPQYLRIDRWWFTTW